MGRFRRHYTEYQLSEAAKEELEGIRQKVLKARYRALQKLRHEISIEE